ALLLPGGDRALPIPGHQQALLLARHVQIVVVVHVEPDAGDLAFYRIPRLHGPLGELHLEIALAMLIGRARQHAEAVIAAVGIDLADGRGEVVQIRFHGIEHRIGLLAVAAATLLPALALRAKQRCRHDVLPLDTLGPVGLRAGAIAAAAGIRPSAGAADPLPTATTVETAVVVTVVVHLLAGQGLGGLETGGRGEYERQIQGTGKDCQYGTTSGSEH